VTIQRIDHVGVVIDDLDAAIAFFVELGMELDGGTTRVEGDWVDRVVGLDEVRVESHSCGRPTVTAGSS
jgi:catechol 2,3-dioxygenase-like lactoylglutathione lyase family enzyme